MTLSAGYYIAVSRVAGIALAVASFYHPPAFSQNSALVDRLQNAKVDTSLDQQGLLPWHLKLEIQFYDSKGKPAEKGSVEEWWAGPKQRLISYSLPDYTGKFLENSDGKFRSKDPGSPENLARILLDQVVHPMPDEEELKQTTPDMRKESFGKISLDCIMLTHPIKGVAYLPLGLYPTYCFDPGKDSLRASYSLGSMAVVRNAMGRFQGHSIPIDVTIDEGPVPSASAHIAELKGMHVNPAQFEPTPDLEPVRDAAHVEAVVMAGKNVKKVQPIYPAAARQRRAEGSVILHAIIGRDGRIQSLKILSTPDADLGLSALAAVQQWVYSPYLLNNRPVEVDTTITVNYKIGPG